MWNCSWQNRTKLLCTNLCFSATQQVFLSPPSIDFNQLQNSLTRVSSSSLKVGNDRVCSASSYSKSFTGSSSLHTSLSLCSFSLEYWLSDTDLTGIVQRILIFAKAPSKTYRTLHLFWFLLLAVLSSAIL